MCCNIVSDESTLDAVTQINWPDGDLKLAISLQFTADETPNLSALYMHACTSLFHN